MNDLAFHIRTHLPDCDGEELEHRTALLKARDYAAWQRSRVASRTALEHAAGAHEMASAYLYADASPELLKVAVGYCRNLVHAAFLAEHLDGEVPA